MTPVFNKFDELISSNSKFQAVINEFMPDNGEGINIASQMVTAVNKIVYRYWNDGDIINGVNNYAVYKPANWLQKHFPELSSVFAKAVQFQNIDSEQDGDLYIEEVLIPLIDFICDDELLNKLKNKEKDGSIYNCSGKFSNNLYYD